MADVNYISADGLQKLKDELQDRKTVWRRDLANQIATAKEQGDLSENFEYSEAKDRQADNEVRIAEIEQMINRSIVIEEKTGETRISVGTNFVAELSDGTKKHFQIVGPTETDPLVGKISNESPLGQAFLGKALGEKAEFKAPVGMVSYKIIEIT